MPEHGASRSDAAAVAAISEALERAGARASADQINRLIEPYEMMQAGLTALRRRLVAEVEPVNVFSSAEAARSTGGANGH